MILIIEDEKEAVHILSDFLKENGYEVFGCYDGNSALKRVKEIKPKVVLLDYNLPHMDGLEVLGKLLNIVDNIKVIMISGHPDPDLDKKAKKAGAFAFLSKPFDLDELLEMVKKAAT